MTVNREGRRLGWLRFVAYPVLCALVVDAIADRVVALGPHPEALDALLDSGGLLAWAQFAIVLAAAALCVSRAGSQRSALAVLLSLLLLAGAATELDDALDVSSLHAAYRRLTQIFGLAVVVYGIARRRRLAAEATAFTRRVGFGLMLAGLLLATGVARLLADSDLWSLLVSGELRSSARHLVQEGVGVVGYLLVAFGALEERLAGVGGHPDEARAQSDAAGPLPGDASPSGSAP